MTSPSVRSTLPVALLMTLIGWAGLVYLFIYTLPRECYSYIRLLVVLVEATSLLSTFLSEALASTSIESNTAPEPPALTLIRMYLQAGSSI